MPLIGRSFKTSFNQGRPSGKSVGEAAAKRAEVAERQIAKKKKPKQVVEVDPKTVKKKRRDLVPVDTPSTALAEVGNVKLESLFGDAAPTIIKMIEADNKDGATLLIYKRLLMTLVSKIPMAEKMLEDTKARRGIYQFNALVSQCRELMADIQSVRDRGMVGRNLVDTNVRPAFLDIATQLVQTNHRLKLAIKASSAPVSAQQELLQQIGTDERELAIFIQERYRSVAEQIVKGLT